MLFWAAAALGIFWEWTAIVAGGAMALRVAGAGALLVAAAACGSGYPQRALAAAALGAVAVASLCPPGRRAWGAAGVLYAGTVLLAPDPAAARPANMASPPCCSCSRWFGRPTFSATSSGRRFGGPKLAPRISPEEDLVRRLRRHGSARSRPGVATLFAAGIAAPVSAAGLAFILSIVAQGGDLFESAIKRRFGVKDASQLIPGHGGLMDRLDGFLAAAGVAALVGLARGGADAPARGLLLW